MFLKKITKILQKDFKKNNFLFVFLIMSLLTVIINIQLKYLLLNTDISEADWPSYINFFDNKNVYNFLDNHRTLGLPLIIKLYQIFSPELKYWSITILIFFFFSTYFLIKEMIGANFSKVFVFYFFIFIIFSKYIYFFLNDPTCIISISFQMITLSFFLKSLKKKDCINLTFFSIFLFLTYQTSPSSIVMPFFFCLFSYYLFKFSEKFFLYLKLSFLPLIFFLILKFIFTGYFNIAPLSGSYNSAHALFLLENKDLSTISEKNKNLATLLVERRNKLSHPCNLSYDETKVLKINPYEVKMKCHSVWFMSNWLVYLKYHTKKEPFPKNDYRNIEAWSHVKTLSSFYTYAGESNKMNYSLSNFANEVLKKNLKKHITFIIYNSINFFNLFGNMYANYILICFCITFIYANVVNKRKNNKNNIVNYFLYSITIYSLANIGILILTNMPDIRHITSQLIFALPTAAAFIIYKIAIK